MKRLKSCIVVAIALVLLNWLLGFIPFTLLHFDGKEPRDVHVCVTHNGKPVEGAMVMLLNDHNARLSKHLSSEKFQETLKAEKCLATTDAKGNAIVSTDFWTWWNIPLLWTGGFYVGDTTLRVIHPSFPESESSLGSLLGKEQFPLRKKKLKVHFSIPSEGTSSHTIYE